jgi:hypothetical protein
MIAKYRTGFVALALLLAASPAAAQWNIVPQVTAPTVFSVAVQGDTILAGADTSVFISTNAGLTWKSSRKPVAGVGAIFGVRVHNGRLFAGTFGQGAFVSDNLGDSWQAFNQGLIGGIGNSQLAISDFEIRGDSLYAATEGAGVYVRGFAPASTWSHFGEEFEPNSMSNVLSLGLGGRRLIAAGGSNGQLLFRDPGDPEWTLSSLDNVGLHPGLTATSFGFDGAGWVVGTNIGVFTSVGGQSPWTFVPLGLGPLDNAVFANRGRQFFGAFTIAPGAVIEQSDDDGASWQVLEGLSGVFVYHMAMSGNDLFAARSDGLWVRSTSTASVPPVVAAKSLSFALVGAQPVRGDVRFRFEMPEAGNASIEVFDIAGRRAAERIQQTWSAGTHEVSLNAGALSAGVYMARLTAAGRQEVVRLVRVR